MNPDDPLGLMTPQKANASDPLGLMTAPQAAQPSPPPEEEPGYLSRLATHVLNTAQGIPGMEALEAGAGTLLTPAGRADLTTPEGRATFSKGYQKSLDNLREMTGRIGGKTAAAERMMGSVATLPFLPANPAVAGGLLGGADQLLSADTDQSLLERGGRTAAGAIGGSLLGKGADVLAVGARAAIPTMLGGTLPADENLIARQLARAKSAKTLYDTAMAEGKGKEATPMIAAFLQEPDVQAIVSELQSTRPFKDVAAHSPEMLDAVYKTFSDQLKTIQKGLTAVNPSKANIGRFQANDMKAAQKGLLACLDETMPSYRAAVDDFASRTRDMDAIKKGYTVLSGETRNALPSVNNLNRTTPASFSDWLASLPPDQAGKQAGLSNEGIIGGVKQAVAKAPFTTGRKALSAAPGLLRRSAPYTGDVTSRLVNGGLLGLRPLMLPAGVLATAKAGGLLSHVF